MVETYMAKDLGKDSWSATVAWWATVVPLNQVHRIIDAGLARQA